MRWNDDDAIPHDFLRMRDDVFANDDAFRLDECHLR
jgi:hypothetical protein